MNRQRNYLASGETLRVVRETGWKLRLEASSADSVPGPDLMVVRQADVRTAVECGSWFEGVSLLVLEVISPSERKSRRMQKVDLYLDAGVQHLVEVNYTRRVVSVHTPDSERVSVYGESDQMVAPIQVAVAEIFARLNLD